METTIVYGGNIGIMEKKMETTIVLPSCLFVDSVIGASYQGRLLRMPWVFPLRASLSI